METTGNTSGIRDNYRRGTTADFLRDKILPGSQLSVVSAYFTIYAFDALKYKLSAIKHLDFLLRLFAERNNLKVTFRSDPQQMDCHELWKAVAAHKKADGKRLLGANLAKDIEVS